jgi:uncharacterized protein (DUF4415 family)
MSSGSFPRERQQQMKKPTTLKKSQTDWNRLKAMKDNEIDLSEAPELTPDLFAKSVVRRGLKPVIKKEQLTIRVDSDVLDWYKKQGTGYQTRINALLRAYMEEHQRKSA